MFATLHTSTMTLRHVQQRGSLSDLLKTLRLGFTAWHQRQSLRHLDDARLADIGLTYAQALAEANRPFWDVPSTWAR